MKNNNITRRDFLKISSKATLGAVALTACGNIIPLTAEAQKAIDEVTVGDNNYITELSKLMEDKAINFIYAGKKSILVYNDGNIKAFENICTHRNGPTALKGNVLKCQWHGATFDPVTGEAIGRPAPKGSKLTEIKVKVVENKIFVDDSIAKKMAS